MSQTTVDLALEPRAPATPPATPRVTPSEGHMLFFKNWLTRPLATAAQAPSSRTLSDAMAEAALPHGPGQHSGPVLEFGPGTGAITDAILDRGYALQDLILIEMNPDFCAFLRSRYAGAEIIQTDALSALRLLKGVNAQGALSGMPLLQFPQKDRLRFVRRCLSDSMMPNGRLSQFTYGPNSPLVRGRHSRIDATRSRRIWRNLYPAVVWTYTLSARDGNA